MNMTVDRKDMAETRGFSHCLQSASMVRSLGQKGFSYTQQVVEEGVVIYRFLIISVSTCQGYIGYIRVKGWPVAADCFGGARELAKLRNSS